ncbi:MAG: hypothetical protein ABR542_10425 [Desulfonatronovibrio sp.]
MMPVILSNGMMAGQTSSNAKKQREQGFCLIWQKMWSIDTVFLEDFDSYVVTKKG